MKFTGPMREQYASFYIALLTAIDQGNASVPALLEILPQSNAETLRNALTLLKGRGLVRSVRKAHAGRPAIYKLVMPLDVSISAIRPVGRRWSGDALTMAWPAPVRPDQTCGYRVVIEKDERRASVGEQ